MPDSQMSEWAQLVVGGIGGAVVTFVTMRTRLALMARDIADEKAARERLAVTLDTHVSRADRRQAVMLQLLVDIAQKVGVTNRLGDTLVSLMKSDDQQHGSENA